MPLKRLNNKVRITSIVLAILGSAMFGYALLNGSLAGRQAALKSGQTATMNIATGLATQVNLSVRAADLLLQEIAALDNNNPLDRRDMRKLVEELLDRQSRLFPEMDTLLVIDEQSRVLQRWPAGGDMSATALSASPDGPTSISEGGLKIGAPMISRVTGHWVIPLARTRMRQGKPAGEFRLGVSLEHFQRLFDEVNIGAQGSLLLGSRDGVMLLRRPYGEQFLGKDMVELPLYRDHVRQRSSGWADINSMQDGIRRLHYVTAVPDYPLFVSAALAHEEMLADWHAAQASQLLVIVAAALIIGLLTAYLLRVVRMRDRAEDEIEKKNLSLKLLTENLRAQAMLDGMTGIPNRRYLDEQLQLVMRNASRSKSALSLVMLDVDYFKKYNDLYGHIQGDYCLQDIARTLQTAQRRQGDLAARYGGEEFAILLPDTDLAGAHRIAQKVVDAVRALAIPHEGNAHGVVTISAGVYTCMPRPETRIEDIFAGADRALYRAKDDGRDRVADYQPPHAVVSGKAGQDGRSGDATT